jgi:hypothetical protein
MVFYYDEFGSGQMASNSVVLLVLATILLPLFIYNGKIQLALGISIILSGVQAFAVVSNVIKYPL